MLPNKDCSTHTSNSEFFNRSKIISRRPERSMSNRQLQECSFKPKINSQQQSTGNIHEKLYLQAMTKQQINKRTENPRKIEVKNADPEERAVVVTRLLNSHIFTDAKIKKTKQKLEATVDLDTNQSFFHPKICREPQIPLEQPVWERLHPSEVAEPTINPEDIYKNFRHLQYKQIFEALDTDNDGIISKNNFNTKALDSRSISLLGKIFSSTCLQNSINFEHFSEILEHNINYLSMEDRMWLLRRSNYLR